jgi:hypothetical protein
VNDGELSTSIGIGEEADHYNLYNNLKGGATAMILGEETALVVREILVIFFYHINLVSDHDKKAGNESKSTECQPVDQNVESLMALSHVKVAALFD